MVEAPGPSHVERTLPKESPDPVDSFRRVGPPLACGGAASCFSNNGLEYPSTFVLARSRGMSVSPLFLFRV